MRLTTGVFWTSKHSAQVGIDPRIGARLNDLPPYELRLVEKLTHPQTQVEFLARAENENVSRRRATQILEALDQANLLVYGQFDPEAEAQYRIFGKQLDARKHASVHITNTDYLGFGIALALANAGVRSFSASDTGITHRADHPELRAVGIGEPRASALLTALRRHSPKTSLRVGEPEQPTLAIVTGSYAVDPFLVGELLASSTPTLMAWVEEADIYVGPLSRPHESPCGTCITLYRQDANPNWAKLNIQALATPPLVPESAMASIAISLATRAALNFIDGGGTGQFWRIRPNRIEPERLAVLPHPKCGCAGGDGGRIRFPDGGPTGDGYAARRANPTGRANSQRSRANPTGRANPAGAS